MKIFIVLLMTLGATLGYSNYVYIGNPCLGVLSEDRFTLKDFAENKVSSPWAGESQSKYDSDLRKSNVTTTGVDLDLLSRKIGDLEKAHPQIGMYIIAVANRYTWQMVDYDLGKLEDNSPVADFPGEVPIANRYLQTIRISTIQWKRLSAVDQTAVVLHEIFFAMTRLSSGENYVYQSSGPVKQFISALYKQETPPERLKQLIHSFTMIPKEENICDHQGSYSFFRLVQGQGKNKKLIDILTFSDNQLNPAQVSLFCQKALSLSERSSAPLTLEFFIYRSPFKLDDVNYRDQHGSQIGVDIYAQDSVFKGIWDWKYTDTYSCTQDIRNAVIDWTRRKTGLNDASSESYSCRFGDNKEDPSF